jgi:hypothetical protein
MRGHWTWAQLLRRARIGAVAVLLALGGVVLGVAFGIGHFWPPDSPTTEADRLAAIGAVFAGGGFSLAVVATIVAVFAYINATEKPWLRIAEPDVLWVGDPVQSMPATRTLVYSVRLANDGLVAARFVAIRITFVGAVAEVPAGRLHPWHAASDQAPASGRLWWEGGADAVVHPGWEYEVPTLGPLVVRLDPSTGNNSFIVRVEIVADDVPAFTRSHTVSIEPM